MSTAPNGWQNPKTNWASADVPLPTDFNRIESNLQAIETGQRTLDPSQAPTGNTGSLRQLLDWFANRIRAITGAANWYDAPATTLAAAKSHIDATSGIHGATSSATANRLIIRDSAGRAKVAAPSEPDDIARKDTVDAHANATSVHGATSSATANRIVIRDANGRAQFADPVNAQDAATKAWVEGNCYLQSQWGRSVATAGYIRFPNGIILQWGTAPSGSSNSVSVTFPIAFPNACLGAVTSKASGQTYEAVTRDYSKTGMTIVNNPEGLNTGTTRYFAIGY